MSLTTRGYRRLKRRAAVFRQAGRAWHDVWEHPVFETKSLGCQPWPGEFDVVETTVSRAEAKFGLRRCGTCRRREGG